MLNWSALETLPEWPHPVPAKVLEHPGLITDRERGLLYWLARHHFTGQGSIVDAGVFLGASTRAFAAGLRDNRRALDRLRPDRKPITSYDLGVFVEGLRRYLTREQFCQALGDWNPKAGESFEPVLRRLLAEDADLFELRIGNLLETASADGPIEIAFFDCLKSAPVDWATFTAFAPHYIPGHTIVIQQDYFYPEAPEHRLRQELLSDCFHYVGQISMMAVFRLVRSIPTSHFERDALQDLSLADELRLFEQAAGRTERPTSKLAVRLSAAGHVRGRHGLQPALELKRAIERDFPDRLPYVLRSYPSAGRVWRRLNVEGGVTDHPRNAKRAMRSASSRAAADPTHGTASTTKGATQVATDANTKATGTVKKTAKKEKYQPLERVQQAVTSIRRRLARALDPTIYVECPCCGALATTFLQHGTKNVPNRKCPDCGSLERHRLHWLYLRERTNLLKDSLKVLHFAPEVALQQLLKAQSTLDYHSADLSSKRAAEHFDICAIPYPDNTFDVILCSHVLEHVPDDRKAMAELFRVMKPGGWGLIEAPYTSSLAETLEDPTVTTDEERTRLYGQADHLRRYGRDYFDRLRSAGFEVKTHRFAKDLPPKLIQKYRLHPHGSITISTKPIR